MSKTALSVACALLLGSLGCLEVDEDRDAPAAHAAMAMLVGDSHTYRQGYADMTADAFVDELVIVEGYNGLESKHWLPGTPAYEAALISEHKPKYVTILLGTNDALYGQDGVPAADYAANIRAIAEQALLDGAGKVILIFPPRAAGHSIAESCLAEYVIAIQLLCGESDDDDIECGPNLFELLETGTHFRWDNIHLNPFGNRIAADELIAVLDELEAESPGP